MLHAVPQADDSVDALMKRRESLLGEGAKLFYERPLDIVRGDGVWLYDSGNRRYLDMYNNVPVVGHCNPKVVAALSDQAGRLVVHSRYLHAGILDYAERLLGLHCERLEQVVFTCSGTEANEAAMMMARIATGGRGFICTDATYHGHSVLVGALTRAPRNGRPDVIGVPFPQLYRPIRNGLSAPELTQAYLNEIRSAIADFQSQGVPLAGLVLCPILANEGLPDIPAGYMKEAARLVREAGGLVILDEVQAGFCRTGQWWGYQRAGIEPDIVTMGKPMGNGLPFGACAASAELVTRFRKRTGHFATFAGTPLHAAVGMAVLDEIESRNLPLSVASNGRWIADELRKLAVTTPEMGDVRGCGLFIGVEWVRDKASRTPDAAGAIRMVNLIKNAGALTSNAGAHDNVVKIRPPLVLDREQAEQFMAMFRTALEQYHG